METFSVELVDNRFHDSVLQGKAESRNEKMVA